MKGKEIFLRTLPKLEKGWPNYKWNGLLDLSDWDKTWPKKFSRKKRR